MSDATEHHAADDGHATPDRVQCLCPVCGADDWENVSLWDEEGVEGRRCDTCENTWDDNWDDCPEGDPLWTTLEQAKAEWGTRSHRVRPRLLDLFCGAGGAAVGYHRAGFDVVGVDINPQPHYPFKFIRYDALEYVQRVVIDGRSTFDAIHASPPCQLFSRLTNMHDRTIHPDLLAPTRSLLGQTGLPWIIENVPGAPMRPDFKLCGCMFGLPRLRRERWFESSWHGFALLPSHRHIGRAVTVVGHPGGRSSRDGCYMGTSAERNAAMGIDWMTQKELSQSIPPAYTDFIGRALLEQIGVAA